MNKQKQMKPIQIITSIYGCYDVLKYQPTQTTPCKFTCFTENSDLSIETWVETQRTLCVVENEELDNLHPRMGAKYFRTHIFQALKNLGTELEYWDIVIRMDWSARLLSTKSIEKLLAQCPKNFDVCTFEHPERSDIYEEADYCIDNNIPKYKWLPMREQVEYYRNQWHPEWYWLSATGLLIMKYSPELEHMLNTRWEECLEWSYQDQLSRDYLVRLLDIKRYWLQDNLRQNEYIDFLNPHSHQL